MVIGMNFLGLSEKLNAMLYRKDVGKLSRQERRMARDWTLTLIREHNPDWSEERVQQYYQDLIKIRVKTVDQWAERNLGG